MRILTLTLAAAAALALSQQAALAGVVITVDKSAQRVSVAVDGSTRYTWPTSTARAGYVTPNGTYRPQRLARKWFSSRYHGSPMPYSIFFRGGFAIHGSYAVSYLGQPASHGCVRLHPENAALLFALVQERRGDTSIVVTGTRPSHSVQRTSTHRVRARRGRARDRIRTAADPRQRGAAPSLGLFGGLFGSPQ